MSVPASRLLWLAWLCFVARAGWHAVLLPLWEGFDEWAHVAYIQRLAAGQGLPLPGQTRITREVQVTLSLTPMPAVPLSTLHLTHDQYWRLPAEDRAELRRRLGSIPGKWAEQEAPEGEKNYEAQQPPLYYLMAAPLERSLRSRPLTERVLALRLAGVLLASLLVPLVFLAVRRAGGGERAAEAAAAVVAAMPMPAMTAARVGNDALSMVLFAALLWSVARAAPGAGLWPALAAGTMLGAGLLTKAYFLTAVPAVAVLYAWRAARDKNRRAALLAEAAVLFGTAASVSFWWYWRNFHLTGSWSGLQQLAGDSSSMGPSELARQALLTDWRRFADIAFNTHLWIGHWSFLRLRGWMYDVFLLAYGLAAAGLIRQFLRRGAGAAARKAAGTAFLLCAWFWLGLAYHEVTFARLGMSSSAGWYAAAVISAEVLLLTVGWLSLCSGAGAVWCLAGGAALFALLDLYAANFVLLPYYTGLIGHDGAGRLPAFHLSQLAGGGLSLMWERVGGGTLPARASLLMWCAHAAATLAIPVLAFRALRRAKPE